MNNVQNFALLYLKIAHENANNIVHLKSLINGAYAL